MNSGVGSVFSGAALAALLGFVCLTASESDAVAKTRSKGQVAAETRAFWPDSDDATEDFGLALSARADFDWKTKHWRFYARAFGRVGALDLDRSLFFAEEGFFAFRSKWVRIRVGSQLLNWTATEAFHPADVMNSRNFDSNVENAEKIGEPMVSVNFRLWQGARLEAFYMPLRIDPNLPGTQSRLSFGPTQLDVSGFGFGPPGTNVGIDIGDVLWIDRDGGLSDDITQHQWAVRFSQTIEGADIALQLVQHNDRNQPTFAPRLPSDLSNLSSIELVPIYGYVTHAGLTYTHVIEDWVVKLEAAYRHFEGVDAVRAPADQLPHGVSIAEQPFDGHMQIAGGLEYGWVYDNDHEATLILEGQAFIWPDGRPSPFEAPFENDVLLGYRHTFNDIDGKEFLLSAISDVRRFPEILVSFNYSQRLNEVWGIRTGFRLVFAEPEGSFPDGLQALNDDHQITFDLIRYF